MVTAFYDDAGANRTGLPRIVPVNGDVSWGRRSNDSVRGPYWMMTMMLRLMADRITSNPDDTDMVRRVHEQAAYLISPIYVPIGSDYLRIGYTDADFLSAGDQDGTINASDDASWKMTSYVDFHRVTRDPIWLDRLRAAIPAILNKYKDPYTAQMGTGGVSYSKYGVLYAIRGQDPNGQGRATLMECGLILGALYLYRQLGAGQAQSFLDYAREMAKSWKMNHKDTTAANGTYWMDLQIDPNSTYDTTPYLKLIGGAKTGIVRGDSAHTFAGLTAAAIINAQLYTIFGTVPEDYLGQVQSIVEGLRQFYIMADGRIINDRDPWIAGYYAPQFVREVLTIPNVDPTGQVKAAFDATASYILTSGVRDVMVGGTSYKFYSADWGTLSAPFDGKDATGFETWDLQGASDPTKQASPEQIMTSCNSALMALAGYDLTRVTGRTLTDPTTGATLVEATGGATLIDA